MHCKIKHLAVQTVIWLTRIAAFDATAADQLTGNSYTSIDQ